jgi:hypothetical protein
LSSVKPEASRFVEGKDLAIHGKGSVVETLEFISFSGKNADFSSCSSSQENLFHQNQVEAEDWSTFDGLKYSQGKESLNP